MVIMVLRMGIGKFLYTPILPVILDEGLFTFNQLSYIASANYGGYLVGSMFVTFGRIGNISLSPHMLSCAAIVMSALIISMALTLGPFDPICFWCCECSNDGFGFYNGHAA
ncbi:YbfB/YjiJ family MFS transporter [Bartonella grahamii]|uniref:Protein of uncharacterized function (DUF1228) n=2 Tax=Bartonella grahamii TaxID=33045 RepID=A0A336NG72_BARGR|nr:Protein of uncharacterised function (DUF1228) [Bartonella grahamii]